METQLEEIGKKAVMAKYDLQKITAADKNRALLQAADALIAHTAGIL